MVCSQRGLKNERSLCEPETAESSLENDLVEHFRWFASFEHDLSLREHAWKGRKRRWGRQGTSSGDKFLALCVCKL